MMPQWAKRIGGLIVVGVFVLTLVGCGTTAKNTGGDDTSTPSTPQNPYVGSASLSGQVVVTAADASKVQDTNPVNSFHQASIVASAAYQTAKMKVLSTIKPCLIEGLSEPDVIIGNATAKLYVLNSDGTTTYTGISSNVTASAYEFQNIKDGKQYIVEIEKVGYDSQGKRNILKLSAPAVIPEGAVTSSAEVSPKTKYAVQMIIEKVVKKAQSANIDANVINQIVDVVANVITDLIDSGDLIIPSQVETYTEPTQNVQQTVGNATAQDMEVLEQLGNDDNVLMAQKEAELSAKMGVENMTLDQRESLLSQLSGGGEGSAPPEPMLAAFAEKWEAGVTVSIDQISTAMYKSLFSIMKNGPVMGVTENGIAYLDSVMVLASKTILTKLYSYYYDESSVTLSAQEKAYIPILKVAFPSNARFNLLSFDKDASLTVPQGLFIFMQLMNMGNSMFSNAAGWQAPQVQTNGPDFKPLQFVSDLNWMDVKTTEVYPMGGSGVYVQEVWLPDMSLSWDQFMSQQDHDWVIANYPDPAAQEEQINMRRPWHNVKALDADVELSVPAGFTGTITKVVLDYPKNTGGRGTTTLNAEGGEISQDSIPLSVLSSPRGVLEMEQSSLRQQAEKFQREAIRANASGEAMYSCRLNPGNWQQNGIASVISDFTEGTCNITVYDEYNNVLLQESYYLVNTDITRVQITYPQGPNMETVNKKGWDDEFVPQVLDVDAQGVARPKFTWVAPELPAGYADKYNLEYEVWLQLEVHRINRDLAWNVPEAYGFKRSNGNNSEVAIGPNDTDGFVQIWDSWKDNGRRLSGTSLAIPMALQPTTRNVQDNYETDYNFGVRPVLIDRASGREVYGGSDTNTQFKVGAVNWTVALKGSIGFPSITVLQSYTQKWNPQTNTTEVYNGTWKIGLFRSGGNVSGVWRDYWSGNDVPGAREPISAGGVMIIQELGTNDQVAGKVINYALPVIKKADNPFLNNNQYVVTVWFDYSNDPESPTQNAVDCQKNPNAYDTWVNFTEKTVGLDMNINYNRGRLDYWKQTPGSMNGTGGDLMDNNGLMFNLDLAAKLFEWGFTAQQSSYGSGDFSNTNTSWKDYAANISFWKDYSINKPVIETLWSLDQNGFPAFDTENMKYVALVRSWDQSVIATATAQEVMQILPDTHRLALDMTGFHVIAGGDLPSDNYVLWVYDKSMEEVQASSNIAPIYVSPATWVDGYFTGVLDVQQQAQVASHDYLFACVDVDLSLQMPAVECERDRLPAREPEMLIRTS